MTVWYAHREWSEQHGRPLYWNLSTDRRWTKIHEYPYPIVEMNVTEVPEADATDLDYWGWRITGEEHPVFVYPHPVLLEICFPYGIPAEVEKGRGRVVRLRVTPAAPAEPPAEPTHPPT